ncbi:MAG: penicillin-binding protein [Bacteroidetes bacterium]|nr:MAG: penicillin-binding protein [Bacteroidota bacterium]
MYAKIIRITWISFAAGAIFFVMWVAAVSKDFAGWFGGMPDLKELENPKNELASELYSADNVLLGKYFREDRNPVTYEELSDTIVNCLLATEDIRFFDHSGIDLKGTFAVFYYLLQGERRGSSTITQQLAKNLFKTRGEGYSGALANVPIFGTLIIKTKEWILAIELEKAYTKKEIMAMYLTTVDFGRNSFGIKVAAKRYFNTVPKKLSIEQTAVLMGMLKAPTFYNPTIEGKYENAMRRRNTVLEQMLKYEYLTEGQFQTLKVLPIKTNLQPEDHNVGLATYFRTAVRNEIMDWCKKQGYDLYSDGLKVYTTIDSRMQTYAEQAVAEHMKELQKTFFEHWKGKNPWIDQNGQEIKGYLDLAQKNTDRYRDLKRQFGDDSVAIAKVMHEPIKMKIFTWENPQYEKDTILSPLDSIRYSNHFLHTGMTSMDPHTGQIKAWVGGINYKYFQFDNVTQPRQPGSTFKPLVYMIAMKEHGYSPCDMVLDAPQTFILPGGGTWTAKNADGGYSNQQYTLRNALARSINSVAALLMKKIKPANLIKYAKDLGITSRLDTVPALCLGANDVKVVDLTGAYATFANQGRWIEPHFITEIRDKNGKVIFKKEPRSHEIIDEKLAYLMTYMLRGSNEESGGTAWGLARYDFKKDNQIAGKTGTTNSHSDGWFMGMTKDLVTGVRVGGIKPTIHFRTSVGQGAKMAMPIFAIYNEKVFKDPSLSKYNQKGKFPEPAIKLDIELDCSKYRPISKPDSSMYIMPTSHPLGFN